MGIEYCYLFDCQQVYLNNEYIGVFGISKSFGERKKALKILDKMPDSHLKAAHSRKDKIISFNDIISDHNEMRHTIDIAKRAALNNSHILLTGETGTGKELFAQSIHNYSNVSDGPFVAVNCSAIPDTL
ncbi:MAG: sigma 54-interacting transcriptional regulator, partial [Clostridia bacterium]